jgi:chitodextrinase
MRVLGTTASGVANETIPGAPQSFTATAASSTQINLSWSAPASNGGAAITSYTLKRGATTIYTGAGTSFSDTGLSFNTGYSYTVLATNSVGDGPTASASATTLVNVPSAPTSFSASGVNSSTINLSWAAPSSNGGGAITSYTLRRNGGVIYTGAGTSFSDGGLAAATGYSYTVLANNSAGAGPTASASASTSAGVPSAPTIIIEYYYTGGFQDEFDNYYNGTVYQCAMYLPNNNGSAIVDNPNYNPVLVDYSYDNVNWTPYIRDNLANTGNNPARFYPFIGEGNGGFYVRGAFRNAVGEGAFSSSVFLVQRY